AAYGRSFELVRCVTMQGGQGEVKHWAVNDPPRRKGKHKDHPPPPQEYRKLRTRVTALHPMTVIQNARRRGEVNAAAARQYAALDAGDVKLAETSRKLRLRVGKTLKVPIHVRDIPAGMPNAPYRLIAFVDATNQVAEDNESNNTVASTTTVQIGPPFVNLTVS